MPSEELNPNTLAHNIPSGLDDTDKIAGKRFWDWAWLISPPTLLSVLVYFTIRPEGLLGLAQILVTILTIGVLLLLHPGHLTVKEWLSNMRHHKRRQKTVMSESHAHESTDTNVSQPTQTWETQDRTQDNTHVKRFYPELNVVERTDGKFVGAIQITGVNMALAGTEDWARRKTAYKQFFNRSCDFDTQVYVSTREFPIRDHIETFEDRQTDEDMRANPIKAQLLQSYMDKTLRDTVQKNLNQRVMYMFVTADQHDIITTGVSNKSFVEAFSDVPVLGDIITLYFGGKELTEQEQKERKAEIVQERLDKLHSQAINPLDGCTSTTLSAEELAVVLREHWTSREAQFDAPSENLLRSSPVHTGQSQE